MYESHFGLSRRPFLSTPDPDCVASGESVDNALAGLTLCVESGQGFGILSAPAGTGKTLLCRKLVSDLSDRFAAVFLANSHFPTRRSLLQAILYELGQPYMRMAEQELRLELQTAARSVRPEKQAVVLVIDEAHLLSDQLLEELRTASNLDLDGTPLFHVILSGQLELEENLIRPGLEALNQRIGCQVTLESLTREESAAYISHRLKWAGADINDMFQPEAIQVICHAADGLPRCLNQLCDHSLLLSYVADEQPVSEATVREALEDLKQLPLHWNEPTAIGTPLEQLRADAAKIDSGLDEAVAESQAMVFETTPAFEEFPSIEPNAVESNEGTAADLADSSSVIEIGDSSSVEVGAPLVTDEAMNDEAVIDEAAADHSTAAIFEVGSDDIEEYAETESSMLDVEPQLSTEALLSEDDSQPVDAAADFPVIAMHRQSIADDGRGFEEELVVDRYAMLDAGLSVAEQRALSLLGRRGGTAHEAPVAQEYQETEDLETQADVVEFGRGADSPQTPVELLDAIEPLICEALDDPTVDEIESAGRTSEEVVSTALPADDDDWAGLTINVSESSVDWIGDEAPSDPIDVVEYDIVQPEIVEPVATSDDVASVSEGTSERKTQGRYANLFSKLRRQQRRSA